MKFLLLTTVALAWSAQAFAPLSLHQKSTNMVRLQNQQDSPTRTTTTRLHAVSALVKKAKEASLRQYVADGIEDDVMEQYKKIKEALDKDSVDLSTQEMGPLRQELTRRKGTITVIAEYKRKLSGSGYIKDVFEPVILSREFREFGASGIAVMADERMGGCTYEDLKVFVEDQRRSRNNVPGPVMIINNDLVIDELQVARTAAYGVSAAVITLDVVGAETLVTLLKACKAVDVEAIVAIASKEEAQQAIDLGARMIMVVNLDSLDAKADAILDLNVPEGQTMTYIATITSRPDKGLEEVEEAWAFRDKGFNCAWISDALYKAGNSEVEHPGAIIKSMKSKSSLRWASPVAQSGRGEGAREYLGDILM
jgi:indole-3-glycerol phosphate synthase